MNMQRKPFPITSSITETESALKAASLDGVRITRFGPRNLRAEVETRLRRYPYFALIRGCEGLDSVRELYRLALRFGRFRDRMTAKKWIKDTFVKPPIADVKINTAAKLINDAATRYSQTSIALEPHTDGSFKPVPFDILMLFTVQADAGRGGETILVAIDSILDRLDAETRARLSEPVYPLGASDRRILEPGAGVGTIRYYRSQMMLEVERRGTPLPGHSASALARLDEILADPSAQFRFRLEPGDLLFVNNHKTLHGRTALAPDSRRLLHRCRLYAEDIRQPL